MLVLGVRKRQKTSYQIMINTDGTIKFYAIWFKHRTVSLSYIKKLTDNDKILSINITPKQWPE